MNQRIVPAISVVLACLFPSATAWACSTAAWVPGLTGSVEVNTSATGVPRINGGCGLKVTGDGHLQDNGAAGEEKLIVRFYFLPRLQGTGSADIFIAYANDAPDPNANLSKLFSVNYDHDSGSITVDASAVTGHEADGGTTSGSLTGDGWHLIEVAWESGQVGGLWLDADARTDPATATFASGAGAVEAFRLGAPTGYAGSLNGMMFFDDYVAHRTDPVGGVLAGDTNLDGNFNQADIDSITAEFLFGNYPEGSTDCNLDSETNSGDVNCVVEKF